MRCDVLIIGAGPTGLVLALWLNKLGVAVRIVDRSAGPATASQALAVQARTLELYRQLDLADAVVARGHRVTGLNFWASGAPKARLPLDDLGAPITPFQFVHIFAQDAHERLLLERLAAAGVQVERQHELLDWTDDGTRVCARLRKPDGSVEVVEAAFLAGCDGAHSTVRHGAGIEFAGGTYEQLFYVADVEGDGAAMNGEIHVDLDESDFLAVFGISEHGRARLVGTVRPERVQLAAGATLQFADVSARILDQMKLTIHKVNWFSTYHVHHRVAAQFRAGRAFLAGDAAHVHSPVGGQGMNTGIGDAINLAWKLASVIEGRAAPRLLDSYDTERRAFARRLVATTDRLFDMASAHSALAQLGRTRVMPLAARLIGRIERARALLFRVLSQTMLDYRDSALSASAGHAHGAVRAGDRLPWLETAAGANTAGMDTIAWQVHVYGQAAPALAHWCARHRMPLTVYPWQAAYGTAGLVRDAAYLLRPDTYIALVAPQGDPDSLDRYFQDTGIGALQRPLCAQG